MQPPPLSTLFPYATLFRSVEGSGHDRSRPLLLVSATPVCGLELAERRQKFLAGKVGPYQIDFEGWHANLRSEEHTSELQSQFHLVCRLLLEKKNYLSEPRR